MGCDIHLFIEVAEEHGVTAWASGEVYMSRNYDLFAKLAGVRSTEAPMIPPRGLPFDLSNEVFHKYFHHVLEEAEIQTFRGYDWVTPDEAAAMLAAGNSHCPNLKASELAKPEAFISNPDWHTPSWLWREEVMRVVPEELVALCPAFRVVLNTLYSIDNTIPGARSRIVFWFDN